MMKTNLHDFGPLHVYSMMLFENHARSSTWNDFANGLIAFRACSPKRLPSWDCTCTPGVSAHQHKYHVSIDQMQGSYYSLSLSLFPLPAQSLLLKHYQRIRRNINIFMFIEYLCVCDNALINANTLYETTNRCTHPSPPLGHLFAVQIHEWRPVGR